MSPVPPAAGIPRDPAWPAHPLRQRAERRSPGPRDGGMKPRPGGGGGHPATAFWPRPMVASGTRLAGPPGSTNRGSRSPAGRPFRPQPALADECPAAGPDGLVSPVDQSGPGAGWKPRTGRLARPSRLELGHSAPRTAKAGPAADPASAGRLRPALRPGAGPSRTAPGAGPGEVRRPRPTAPW